MNKKMIVVVVVVVLAGGGVVLALRHNDNSGSMNDMHMSGSSSSSSSSTSEATNSVTVQNFAFSPADITVKKGTAVTWTNKDGATHTVSESDGKTGPNSGSLDSGKSYSFTFNTVGMFKYRCDIHPEMTGTVTVTN